MSPQDRQTIHRKLRYLQKHVDVLSKTMQHKESLKDLVQIAGVERLLQTSIQSMIDAARLLVIIEDLRPLRDEREAITILYERGVFDEDLQLRMLKAKGLRNILVHEYADIDVHRLLDILPTMIADLQAFAVAVTTWMGR